MKNIKIVIIAVATVVALAVAGAVTFIWQAWNATGPSSSEPAQVDSEDNKAKTAMYRRLTKQHLTTINSPLLKVTLKLKRAPHSTKTTLPPRKNTWVP